MSFTFDNVIISSTEYDNLKNLVLLNEDINKKRKDMYEICDKEILLYNEYYKMFNETVTLAINLYCMIMLFCIYMELFSLRILFVSLFSMYISLCSSMKFYNMTFEYKKTINYRNVDLMQTNVNNNVDKIMNIKGQFN